MNTLRLTVLASCLAAITGCWPLSMNPLYEKDEGEMMPALIGTWRQVGQDQTTYLFEEDVVRRGYHVTITDADHRQGYMKVTVVALGDARFLDVTAVWGQPNVHTWYQLHSLPLHAIFRMELTPDGELFVTPIVETVLINRLKNSPDLLEHRWVDVINEEGKTVSRPVLTASTKDLRVFYEQHAKDAELFADPVKLVRIADEPQP